MPNTKKEPLFALVKSLSKSEKRNFKLFTGRIEGNLNSNFMELFKLLDNSSNYHEKEILEKTSIKKTQLSNTKVHLYKQILSSLRNNPLNKNTATQIREFYDFSLILYNKGLYKQGLKILDKAKNLALEHYETNLVYEILELEKVIESQHITRSMENRSDILINQSNEMSRRINSIATLSNLSLQLYGRLLKFGHVKNNRDSEEVKELFYDKLTLYSLEDLSFKELFFLYKAFLWYGLLQQDFLMAYRYAQKWVMLFETNPPMKILHTVYYLKGINYLLESLFFVKRNQKFIKTLSKLESLEDQKEITLNQNTKTLLFLYKSFHRLNLYFLEGDFNKGLDYIPTLIKSLHQHKNWLDTHHQMVLYYKIACMYFGVGDNKKCIFYLEKIMKNKELKLKEDLQCFTRVLDLVAHYEEGLDYHIEQKLKSTYKFLIKMNDLNNVQQKMISFLKKIGKIYPHEIKNAFIDFHKELVELEDHPYEKRAFLYLDIISWLESKISNQPVEEIIKAKAQQLAT